MTGEMTKKNVRDRLEEILALGHAEFVPEDAHLPREKRRLQLTERGKQYAEAFLGIERQE